VKHRQKTVALVLGSKGRCPKQLAATLAPPHRCHFFRTRVLPQPKMECPADNIATRNRPRFHPPANSDRLEVGISARLHRLRKNHGLLG
jgi:hypothetical protein